VIGAALAIVWRRPQVFVLVAVTALTTNVLTSLVKLAVHRDRPPTVILDPQALTDVPGSSSFPSGHASTSFACAYVISRLAPRLTVFVFVLAALIAFSRVYVGVHYPLDVLVGAIFGLLVAKALLMLREALRRSRQSRRAG
jgi:undecaprenyl-diphosphatase